MDSEEELREFLKENGSIYKDRSASSLGTVSYQLKRKRDVEATILHQLMTEGIVKAHSHESRSGTSFFVSIGDHGTEYIPRRPPRLLEKLQRLPFETRQMNEKTKHSTKELRLQAQIQHKADLARVSNLGRQIQARERRERQEREQKEILEQQNKEFEDRQRKVEKKQKSKIQKIQERHIKSIEQRERRRAIERDRLEQQLKQVEGCFHVLDDDVVTACEEYGHNNSPSPEDDSLSEMVADDTLSSMEPHEIFPEGEPDDKLPRIEPRVELSVREPNEKLRIKERKERKQRRRADRRRTCEEIRQSSIKKTQSSPGC